MGINLDPLFSAPWYIQVHALTAMIALPLGIVQFLAPKGTLPHKTLGTVWVMLMIATSVSSAFILRPAVEGGTIIDRLSFFHIFTFVTAVGALGGIAMLLSSNPMTHRRHWRPFAGIFIGGLVVAGALAFTPGRIMHEVAFGG